jgi:molecular chaperone GrpE
VTADLVEQLLAEVYEPLGRALTREEPDAETLLEGVEMVREQFVATLAADGVEILDPEPGTTLDRNRHTVERTVPAETDEGTVCEVLAPGFTVDGEVVTKARVFVAE